MASSKAKSSPHDHIILAVLATAVVASALTFVAGKMFYPPQDTAYNAQISTSAIVDSNKKTVLAFEEAAFNQHDIEKALTYLADDYKQHNPQFQDGKEGFKSGLEYLFSTYPNMKVEVKRVIADENFVVIHVAGDMDSTNPTSDKKAIIDIFRMENGKIAEHWDVLEDVPAESANSNTMF